MWAALQLAGGHHFPARLCEMADHKPDRRSHVQTATAADHKWRWAGSRRGKFDGAHANVDQRLDRAKVSISPSRPALSSLSTHTTNHQPHLSPNNAPRYPTLVLGCGGEIRKDSLTSCRKSVDAYSRPQCLCSCSPDVLTVTSRSPGEHVSQSETDEGVHDSRFPYVTLSTVCSPSGVSWAVTLRPSIKTFIPFFGVRLPGSYRLPSEQHPN